MHLSESCDGRILFENFLQEALNHSGKVKQEDGSGVGQPALGSYQVMNEEGRLINRTGLFIISFQLDGLCSALRSTVPHRLEPSSATITLLKKLHDDFASLSTGPHLQGFPIIDESLSAVDVLALAETLRFTVLSFLSPEELAEQKKIGFSPQQGSAR